MHAYSAANEKVDELKQDLLALLAQMKAAADAGDEAAYNALKEKVASAKSKLRLAEIQAEDALAAYNEAASQAPGAHPMALETEVAERVPMPETPGREPVLTIDLWGYFERVA